MILLSEDRQGSKSRCAIKSYKHALFFRYPQCGNRPLYNGILSVKKTCESELDLKNYIGDGVSIIGFFSWIFVGSARTIVRVSCEVKTLRAFYDFATNHDSRIGNRVKTSKSCLGSTSL